MGDRQRTQQNLEVVRTDAERGLIFVRGSVPGSKNSWMVVRDAVKVPLPETAPFPGAMRRNADETASEEADAGLIESAAEHEVNPEVSAEQQEKLMQQQDAGADAETGAADDNSTTPSVDKDAGAGKES